MEVPVSVVPAADELEAVSEEFAVPEAAQALDAESLDAVGPETEPAEAVEEMSEPATACGRNPSSFWMASPDTPPDLLSSIMASTAMASRARFSASRISRNSVWLPAVAAEDFPAAVEDETEAVLVSFMYGKIVTLIKPRPLSCNLTK